MRSRLVLNFGKSILTAWPFGVLVNKKKKLNVYGTLRGTHRTFYKCKNTSVCVRVLGLVRRRSVDLRVHPSPHLSPALISNPTHVNSTITLGLLRLTTKETKTADAHTFNGVNYYYYFHTINAYACRTRFKMALACRKQMAFDFFLCENNRWQLTE